MKRKLFCVLLLAVVLAFGNCGKKTPPQGESKLLDPKGNFTLYVSNLSFAITPIDIQVDIDGEIVVHEYFDVGNQHNLKAFKLSLQLGHHRLKVSSVRGEAELSQEFEVKGVHWATIGYWYYPKSHYNPTPKHFTFNIQDKPIGFI